MASTAPVHLTIRQYNVGFGDCFLLSFEYARKTRHVLVDCGSSAGAPSMEAVAGNIQALVGQPGHELTAAVVTHRHLDHISGFAGKPWSESLSKLKPRIVVQPWTEDPLTTENARQPTGRHAFCASLSAMAAVAGKSGDELEDLRKRLGMRSKLTAIEVSELNLKNADAVRNLRDWSPQQEYVYAGYRTRLGRLLPGVKVKVLGPPTLQQSGQVASMRSDDDAEFWMSMARDPAIGGGRAILPADWSTVRNVPIEARWFARRIERVRLGELKSIVRILDDVLNNTSVILFMEVGGHRLLFPGDAQIENWAYALKNTATMRLLAETDVYKVGHHGSRNATPRTLWESFQRRGNGLVTLLSSKAGKHGDARKNTEVPRKTLVQALAGESKLYSTMPLRVAGTAKPLLLKKGQKEHVIEVF